jgi:hypothetical protein
MELDEAIADQKALSSFTVAIEQMEKLGLGTFENLYQGFMKSITDARRFALGGTSTPTTLTTPPEVKDIVEEIEEESEALPEKQGGRKFNNAGIQDFASSLDPLTSGHIGTGGGSNTVITVNTGALLGSTTDVELAVISALEQAKRKGITVAT